MTKIFISYSHKDNDWKDRLVQHIQPLVYQGLLDLWDDSRIGAGQDWEQQIDKAINDASVALLLVSAASLSSLYILEKEVPRLLERNKTADMSILPVILKPCAWKRLEWLAPIQVRPPGGRAISTGSDAQIDTDLTAIANELADLTKISPSQFTNQQTSQSQSLPLPTKPTSGANYQAPLISHNILRNGWPCMDLQVPGFLGQALGRQAQIVVRFFFQDGQPLFAHPQEMQYRDAQGYLVTAKLFVVPINPCDLSQILLSIPYYAFNLQPTGWVMSYPLATFADIYVDNALIARTATAFFNLSW